MIALTHGRSFDERDLVAAIRTSGRNYIIQGQQHCTFENQTKPQSLDYWLRQRNGNSDTNLAENSVVDALVGTGLFELDHQLECPDTGELCRGLRLVD